MKQFKLDSMGHVQLNAVLNESFCSAEMKQFKLDSMEEVLFDAVFSELR